MTNSVALPHPPSSAASQGTLIESNRVAAEVYAAILVAQQCPRDIEQVQEEVIQVCRMKSLASKAFFKYPTGGKTLTGPTIRLALELVRIWRNTQWGIVELDRTATRSELLAYAWDCQTNARSARTVIVERKRDRSGEEPEDITDMRAIMTNNTSIASRHLRETIWTILPLWLTETATEQCYRTLNDGGQVPLPRRIKNCVDHFLEMGVRREQLVAKLHGRPVGEWDVLDLSTLLTTYSQITNGQTTSEAEFPPPPVTGAQVTAAVTSVTSAAAKPADPTPAPELPTDRDGLEGVLAELFTDAGLSTDKTGRAQRLRFLTIALRLPSELGSVHDLTDEQLTGIVQVLLNHKHEGVLISGIQEVLAEPEPGTGS